MHNREPSRSTAMTIVFNILGGGWDEVMKLECIKCQGLNAKLNTAFCNSSTYWFVWNRHLSLWCKVGNSPWSSVSTTLFCLIKWDSVLSWLEVSCPWLVVQRKNLFWIEVELIRTVGDKVNFWIQIGQINLSFSDEKLVWRAAWKPWDLTCEHHSMLVCITKLLITFLIHRRHSSYSLSQQQNWGG